MEKDRHIIIYIPVYIANELHLDFTIQTIKSIKESEVEHINYEIVLVENYCADQYKEAELALIPDSIDRIIHNKKNSVSSAWNIAMKDGMSRYDKDTYIMILNNDIILHPHALRNLIKFADEHPEFSLWSGCEHSNIRSLKRATYEYSFDEHPHFSFFMLQPDNFVGKLKGLEENTGEPYPGYFDENIAPAYLEDNDMHQRLLRQGLKAGITASALFYHYGSRTIKTDEELFVKNLHTHEYNRKYFKLKWGFDVDGIGIGNQHDIRHTYARPFNSNPPAGITTG